MQAMIFKTSHAVHVFSACTEPPDVSDYLTFRFGVRYPCIPNGAGVTECKMGPVAPTSCEKWYLY